MSSIPKIRLVNITILNFLTRIIFYVFVFIAGYISSRKLSLNDFGQIQYVSLWIMLSWVFLGLGVPSTITRYFTQAYNEGNKRALKKIIIFSVCSCSVTLLLITGLFVLLYHKISFGIPFMPVLFFALTQSMLTYLNVIIQSMYKYKTTFWLNLVASLAGGVFLLLSIESLGKVSYIYAFLIVTGILCIGYLVVIGKGLLSFSDRAGQGTELAIPSLQALIKTSFFYASSAILAGILWQRFEISFLKLYFNYESIAIYGIAFTVLALFSEPLKMVTSVLLYYYAGLGEKDERASAQFTRFFKLFSWVVIYAGMYLWFDAESIISIIYTEKYLESAIYLRILLIGLIPGICSYVLMNMHVGLGKARFLLIQDLIAVTVFILLLVGGNYFWGLYGAAWAKSISIIISVILGLWYTSKRLKFMIPYLPLFAAFVLCTILLFVATCIKSDSMFVLATKAVIGFLLYFIVSIKLKIIDKELIGELYNRIREMVAKTN